MKDLIEREAVIEWLKEKDIIKMSWQEENARKELQALPSAEPKQGHWDIRQSPNRTVIVCSCCLQPIYEPHQNYYYCPSCGAKMSE